MLKNSLLLLLMAIPAYSYEPQFTIPDAAINQNFLNIAAEMKNLVGDSVTLSSGIAVSGPIDLKDTYIKFSTTTGSQGIIFQDGSSQISAGVGSFAIVSNASQFTGDGLLATPLTLNSSSVTLKGNTGFNFTNWDSAYSWGNHAGLYLLNPSTFTMSYLVAPASFTVSNIYSLSGVRWSTDTVSMSLIDGSTIAAKDAAHEAALSTAVYQNGTAVLSSISISGSDFSVTKSTAFEVLMGLSVFRSTIVINGTINFARNSNSVGVGNYTLIADTDTNHYNTAIGDQALMSNTTGQENTCVGAVCLKRNTTGRLNVALGSDTLTFNDSGNFNTGVGWSALYANISGNQNSAFGNQSLVNNLIGIGNTGAGAFSLLYTSGDYNSGFGYNAGLSNTTGTYNSFFGYGADAYIFNSGLTNATAIGKNAKVNCNNCMVLGGTGSDLINVGIGKILPTVALDVVGTINATKVIADGSNVTNIVSSNITAGSLGTGVISSSISLTVNLTISTITVQSMDSNTSSKTTLLTLSRTGGINASYTERAVGLVFKDGLNTTVGSGIAGYRKGADAYNGGLAFYTYAPSGAIASTLADLAERMRIDSGGLVGIGTSSPSTKLHISSGVFTVDGSGAGITVNSLPTSAGGSGLYVCVDSAGVFYKKSSCP